MCHRCPRKNEDVLTERDHEHENNAGHGANVLEYVADDDAENAAQCAEYNVRPANVVHAEETAGEGVVELEPDECEFEASVNGEREQQPHVNI